MAKYKILLLLLILIILSGQAVANEFTLEGYVTQSLSAMRFKELPGFDDYQLYSDTALGFSLFYKQLQIDVNTSGRTSDFCEFDFALNELLVSGCIESGIFELGKKNWTWGQGFTFSPTFPLDRTTNYWGGQLIHGNWSFGAALDEENKKLLSIWNKVRFLQEKSDISVVLSYHKDKQVTYYPVFSTKEVDALNMGFDYSRELIWGIGFYTGLNLKIGLDEDPELQYVIGGNYVLPKDFSLTLEHYQDGDKFMLISLDKASFFSPWKWGVRGFVNLTDGGQTRIFDLEYNNGSWIAVPSVEIMNFTGPEDSIMSNNPINYQVGFKVKFNI